MNDMSHFRIKDAARLVGVSTDTVRRWVSEGVLESSTDEAGVQIIHGASLAELLTQRARAIDDSSIGRSARNAFTGIVTDVKVDGLVAVVELHAGPHRVVSMMTAEAAESLKLEVGSLATAVVKATQVIIETPRKDH